MKIGLAALLLLAPAVAGAQAIPIAHRNPVARTMAFVRRDWKPAGVLVFDMLSSGLATTESHKCRQKFSAAPCQGGYGEFAAREGVRGAMSLTMGLMSWVGYRRHYKEWFLPGLGWGTYNTYVAIHESTIGCPTGEHFLYGTKFTCVPDVYYPRTWNMPRPRIKDLPF